jgi:flagellin
MSLRINTNVSALSAHKNMIKNDNSMSSSLEKLSSGLRINKAADDASGMAIADSLRSQSLGLGQAIRNGNDGISIVQTADAALEESINIVNTIKQKAIQSAQDGQTTESRKAIQADISKLRDELDTIAKTTAFNNQKLLSGNFTDKKFQIGAYAGETVNISIQSTEATKIGHVTTSDLTFSGEGTAALSLYSNLKNETFDLNEVSLQYNNSRENSLGAVADSINKLSDTLGISATAVVQSTTNFAIAEGTTDESFAINGVTIGSLNVSDNDSDGALVAAINGKTDQHGVVASINNDGTLTLSSSDGRAISVDGGSATGNVLGRTTVDEMSTFGKIEVRQEGTSEIVITDKAAGDGAAVSTVDGGVYVGSGTETGVATIAATGTRFGGETTLGSGSVIAGTFTTSAATASATAGDMLGEGTILAQGSIINSGGAVLQADMWVSGGAATSDDGSVLKAGSTLGSGSTLDGRTIFYGDVSGQLSGGAAGVVFVSGTGANKVTVASGGAAVKTGGLTVSGDSFMGSGSTIASNTFLTAGSSIQGEVVLEEDATLEADMALTSGSVINSSTVLATGSTINDQVIGAGQVDGTMTLAVGTIIGSGSFLADGSTFGSNVTTNGNLTVAADGNMMIGSGSVMNSGSILTAGSYIGSDIVDDQGNEYKAGTVLAIDITLSAAGAVATSGDFVLAAGSIIKSGSTLAVNTNASATSASSETSVGVAYRLSDVDVTTQAGAQLGISIADASLKGLDKVRSDLGSVQNQLTSTIANISTTRVNVKAAESTIRDVDFAEESSNFTKMQILSQAGTFALSQANSSSQQVLSLLQ